jgi:hypothetical protein
MNPIRLGVTVFVSAIAALVLFAIVGALLGLAVKIGILAAIALVVYGLLSGNKPLGSGRGRLP